MSITRNVSKNSTVRQRVELRREDILDSQCNGGEIDKNQNMECDICGDKLDSHKMYTKCLIIKTCYTENGKITERGKERMREFGLVPSKKLLTDSLDS